MIKQSKGCLVTTVRVDGKERIEGCILTFYHVGLEIVVWPSYSLSHLKG